MEYNLDRETTDGRRIVIKVVNLGDQRTDDDEFINEIQAMQSIDHPNIVWYLHCSKLRREEGGEKYPAIYMEECNGGDLEHLWKSWPNKVFKDKELKVIATQILEGMKYYIDKGIVHYDLKPQNILIHFPAKPDDDSKKSWQQGWNSVTPI